jgi:8-oxo-dGTP pyrophosphatase MutT (NUDIX family)
VLRPSSTRFEVCLVRRHDEVAFMGGAHVFPGGRLDDGDQLADPSPVCDGLDAAAGQIRDLTPDRSVAHHVGAIRELFEEAGLLLARPVSGQAPSPAELAAQRTALMKGATSIGPLARALDVRLSCQALIYFANWQTPESEAKRYDVRFFLARAPEGQAVSHDGRETTESLWIDPADATARCRSGELLLAPPTWTTLRWLDRFTTVDEALVWARLQRPSRIQPRLFEREGQRMLALPGDDVFPPVDGFDTPRETRFHFGDGRWRPVVAG